MRARRRLFYYILLNVLISGLTTWLVLTVWMRANPYPTTNVSSAAGLPVDSVQDAAQPLSSAQTTGQMEIDSVIGAGDLESERVMLRQIGEGDLNLAGWRLVDEQGNEYVFPTLVMHTLGAITVYTKSGIDIVVELHWGLDEPVWEVGEVATLLDADGNIQATYPIP